MKQFLNTCLIFLLFLSCTGNNNHENPSEINAEKKGKEDLAELIKSIETNNGDEIKAFNAEVDRIEAQIDQVSYENLRSDSVAKNIQLSAPFMIFSIHEYDTLDIVEQTKIDFLNINHSVFRLSHIQKMPTQTERDLKHLTTGMNIESDDFYSYDTRYSQLSAVFNRYEKQKEAKYVIIIKDYAFLNPKVIGLKQYESGEVISGVFLYDRSSQTIADQFMVRTLNNSHIQFKETGDFEKDKESAQYKLDTGIKSNYNKTLKEAIKNRYSIQDSFHLFF